MLELSSLPASLLELASGSSVVELEDVSPATGAPLSWSSQQAEIRARARAMWRAIASSVPPGRCLSRVRARSVRKTLFRGWHVLERSVVEVLVEGLSQGVDPAVKPHGRLDAADNVEFDRAGALNKRRGMRRVALPNDIDGHAIAEVFSAVAIFDDELVLFSDDLYAVVSPRGGVDGTTVVRRGPVLRGAYVLRDVIADGIGVRT